MQEELLGTAQVAEILDRSVPTINRWVHEGRLKPVSKLPGHSGAYVFRRSDIEALRHERQAS